MIDEEDAVAHFSECLDDRFADYIHMLEHDLKKSDVDNLLYIRGKLMSAYTCREMVANFSEAWNSEDGMD